MGSCPTLFFLCTCCVAARQLWPGQSPESASLRFEMQAASSQLFALYPREPSFKGLLESKPSSWSLLKYYVSAPVVVPLPSGCKSGQAFGGRTGSKLCGTCAHLSSNAMIDLSKGSSILRREHAGEGRLMWFLLHTVKRRRLALLSSRAHTKQAVLHLV